ncbi:MAG: response regulator [Fidelibacterota bacterium]
MKLLVIDDDPDIRMVARMMLETRPGLEVAEAGTRAEAVHQVSAFQPNIILLDYQLGDDKGDDVLEEIRRIPAGKNAQVIFITASVSEKFHDYLLTLSVAGVIRKPLDLDSFVDQVFHILHD